MKSPEYYISRLNWWQRIKLKYSTNTTDSMDSSDTIESTKLSENSDSHELSNDLRFT